MTDGALLARSLGSITRGALIFAIGLAAMNVLGFVFTLLLTRYIGVEQYGIYAYTATIVGLLMMVTNLGADKSILKYIPEYEQHASKQRDILGMAYLTAIAGGIGAGSMLFLAAPVLNDWTLQEPAFVVALRLFSILVCFTALWRIVNRTFRSLELIEYEVFVTRVVRPLANVGCVLAAILLGLSFIGVLFTLVLASAIALLASLYLFITRVSIRPRFINLRATREEKRAFFSFSVPLTLVGGSSAVTDRFDILLVGLLLTSAAVGVYNIALMFAGALLLPLVAINQLFPPVASRLHANGWDVELKRVYGTVTRWAFTISVPMALIIILYRRELLDIFGSEFTVGASVLALIVCGQLVNSLTGPARELLMMTGHQYIPLANKLLFGSLNVLLTYLLIQWVGLLGAGLATFLVLVTYHSATVVEIWYLEQLHPFTLELSKPIIAGGATAVVLSLVSLPMQGIALVVVGGAFTASIYAVTLVLLGIEATDREFFRAFAIEFTSMTSGR